MPQAPMRPGRRILLACLLGLAAGGGASQPAAPASVELTISAGLVPAAQRLIRVLKDDTVQLRVMSDASGELHLHAYDLKARLEPGVPQDLRFKAWATGRFRLEWHGATAAPQAAGGHAHASLATLEVHPR
jgi:hypothetical protein